MSSRRAATRRAGERAIPRITAGLRRALPSADRSPRVVAAGSKTSRKSPAPHQPGRRPTLPMHTGLHLQSRVVPQGLSKTFSTKFPPRRRLKRPGPCHAWPHPLRSSRPRPALTSCVSLNVTPKPAQPPAALRRSTPSTPSFFNNFPRFLNSFLPPSLSAFFFCLLF